MAKNDAHNEEGKQMNRFESYSKRLTWLITFVLTGFVAGCGGGGGGGGTAAVPGPTPVSAAGVVCDPGVSTGCVNLGTAGTYVILAQAGTTNISTSAVTGDIGTSPIASTATTGFSETMDASNTFATSAQVTGKMYASDYAAPTPANLTTAVNDSITAYGDAAGRPAGTGTNLNHGAGTIGSETLPAGTYTWSTGVNIATDLTLNGSATDVWIFQISGNLTQANATNVILTGGALAKNVFWQVGGGAGAAIGTTAHFEGIIITPKAVTMGTGASLNGRVYTGTNVTLDGNTVTRPGT
jgi:hypothetical protein